jgi:hypothetical protein
MGDVVGEADGGAPSAPAGVACWAAAGAADIVAASSASAKIVERLGRKREISGERSVDRRTVVPSWLESPT